MIRQNRGARIRTGDLCDPNAALYRTEPRPVKVCLAPASRPGEHPAEAEGLEPPSARRTPHFECGALPIRTTPPRVDEASVPHGEEGVGWTSGRLAPLLGRLRRLRLVPHPPPARTSSNPTPSVRYRSRREWDGPPGGLRRSSGVSGVCGSCRIRLRLEQVRTPLPQFATAHGGSGIRTHVVTGTNALAGRRF